MQDLIRIQNISYRYDGGEILRFPDFDIAKGQHTLLLGESGSGKTTLLHVLTGLLAPASGEVKLLDTSLYQLNHRDLDHFRGQHIGIVFQNAHLLNSLTLHENLQIAQSFAGKPIDHRRITEVLTSLQLGELENRLPKKLSRGQLQRAAIARAVINGPALLVADEPTAALDDHNTERVMELLLDIAQTHGATLLIATHDQRIKHHFAHQYILSKS
jgi:ABC-type lipoprotein export system ATPase subunit